ncbi:MAG: TIGR02147 family protein [Deltaproteobacteria bacterium]|nr:TIGR02147 family protein [Deltaproteobacteria bacterium]
MTKSKTDIFTYLDYRAFLNDLSEELRATGQFNLRDFAKKAKLRSPGYLKMIIDGRRNIKDDTAKNFSKAFLLNKKQSTYFLTLVQYNQEADPDKKTELFSKLIKQRPRSQEFKDDKNFNEYISEHHYVTIREMVMLKDFKEDYKFIAKRCYPAISPDQARKAVKTLIKLGLLKRDKNDDLKQTEQFVHTPDRDTQIAASFHHHENVLEIARQALIDIPQEERSFYALTVPLPKKMFEEVIQDFYAFRDRIVSKLNELEGSNEKFDDVYQINFQLFPVTKNKSKKGESS